MPKLIEDPTASILEVAKEILYDKDRGYAAINMRDIAKKCGIAIGTIYNYFPDKETLMTRLMMDYWNRFLTIVDDIVASEDNFFVRLSRLYANLSDFVSYFHEVFIASQGKVILKKSDYDNPTRQLYMQRLLLQITTMVEKSGLHNQTLSHSEIADFILSNFMTISFLSDYSYELFEKVLRTLLE